MPPASLPRRRRELHALRRHPQKLGDAHLSDSTGLALELGAQNAITKEWGVFASVVKVDAKTRLSTSGGADLGTTINLKPMVYSAGISYSF